MMSEFRYPVIRVSRQVVNDYLANNILPSNNTQQLNDENQIHIQPSIIKMDCEIQGMKEQFCFKIVQMYLKKIVLHMCNRFERYASHSHFRAFNRWSDKNDCKKGNQSEESSRCKETTHCNEVITQRSQSPAKKDINTQKSINKEDE